MFLTSEPSAMTRPSPRHSKSGEVQPWYSTTVAVPNEALFAHGCPMARSRRAVRTSRKNWAATALGSVAAAGCSSGCPLRVVRRADVRPSDQTLMVYPLKFVDPVLRMTAPSGRAAASAPAAASEARDSASVTVERLMVEERPSVRYGSGAPACEGRFSGPGPLAMAGIMVWL